MNTFTDQMGHRVEIAHTPQRIVSLVPSQTELLHDLGLEDEVVGITKFCVHPESWFKSKQRVGGTKLVHMEVMESLQPDLIIGNKEENEEAQVKELMQRYPVWMSDVKNLHEATEMIFLLGQITGRQQRATELIDAILNSFGKLEKARPLRTAYFIWHNPWMVAGSDTFVEDMLSRMGLHNCFAEQARYPEVSAAALQEAAPELLLLSSEPFPFKEKHVAELKALLPDAKVQLVDGELFSWYGSRLAKTPAYLAEVLATLEK